MIPPPPISRVFPSAMLFRSLTEYGIGMQVPPTIGHSKTLVVPVDAVAAIGRRLCFTLHVPGPENPPPTPHVSKSKLNGTIGSASCRERVRKPAAAVIDTSNVCVVFNGTSPNATLVGVALGVLTPVPLTEYGIGMEVPPTIGHSKTLVVPVDAVAAVGRKLSFTLHVPGPANPPPVPHVSKSKLNGTLIPDPEAISVRYPASTDIETSPVAAVFIAWLPNATAVGLAPAVLIPAPLTEYGIAIPPPPPIVPPRPPISPLFPYTTLFRSLSFTLHVPGPAKPPPVPHVSKSKENGTLIPDPEAI